MKAVVFQSSGNLSVENVPDPQIIEPTDAIVKVTRAAICGSDLHMYDGYIPTVEKGDILGHEFMGEIIEVGSDVKKVKVGDRVVVPFNIACGECFFCKEKKYSVCERTNPNAEMQEKVYGYQTAGLFGYSHLFGGYCGGQAQFVRVPLIDVNHITIPPELPDEKVLFIGDIFSTGYMAAENAEVKSGSTIAIWGCGPVGQFTIASAFIQGAKKVIAIDRFPERLKLAQSQGATVINYEGVENMVSTIKELTDGRGPDAVIDAVGLEAHDTGLGGLYDKAKQTVRLQTDRGNVLREVIQAARPGSVVSIPGVYGGVVDKFPIGSAFNKALTLRMGQTHTHNFIGRLLEKIQKGEIDPSFVITHRVSIDKVPEMYKIFRDKEDHCIKVVIDPWK